MIKKFLKTFTGLFDHYWPVYIFYVIVSFIDRFITELPNIIYLPILVICLAVFVAAMIKTLLEILKEK